MSAYTFRFHEAAIARAVRAERVFPLRAVRLAFRVGMGMCYGLVLAGIAAVPLVWLGVLEREVGERMWGAALLVAAITLPMGSWYWFYVAYLREPPLPVPLRELPQEPASDYNLAEYLDFEAAEACDAVITAHPQPRANNLFEVLTRQLFVKKIFTRTGIAASKFSRAQDQADNTPLDAVMVRALAAAQELGSRHIGIPSLLLALADQYQPFAAKLFEKEIRYDEFRTLVHWERYQEVVRERRKKFWLPENLEHIRPIGLEWARSGTWRLEKHAADMREALRAHAFMSHAIGREEEVRRMEEALMRTSGNNVLLVGRPGVGRHALAYRFAESVISGEGVVALKHYRVFELDLAHVISQGRREDDVANEVRGVFNEAASAGNVILILDNIDRYLESVPESLTPDLSGVLVNFLPLPSFRLVAITTQGAYRRVIEPQKDILAHFTVLNVEELENPETQFVVLLDAIVEIEARIGAIVTFPAMKTVLSLAKQYFPNDPFPEKAIDLAEASAAHALQEGRREVSREDVESVVGKATRSPVGKADAAEREKLLHLEDLLHERVINQHEAITVLAEALRRVRAQVRSTVRPIGSFLFLGPTGVGKTETAKSLAAVYYGSEEQMIRLDMSEYQNEASLGRLIGSPDGKEAGRLSSEMLAHPFSLVLLDEIEKAHPKVLDILLQVLDEGRYTDARGDKISFVNAIIIATSNAGSEFIREKIQQGISGGGLGKEVVEYVLREHIFKPELLNRFDAVVCYPPLSQEHLVEVAKLLLKDLASRVFDAQGITLAYAPEVASKVAELGYDPQFGARPMRRLIQDKIEGLVARRILENQVKRGDTVNISISDIEM